MLFLLWIKAVPMGQTLHPIKGELNREHAIQEQRLLLSLANQQLSTLDLRRQRDCLQESGSVVAYLGQKVSAHTEHRNMSRCKTKQMET